MLTKLNLTTVSFICSQCLFQKLETTASRAINCKCLQKNKVPRHPEASSSLSFWCTPQTTPYIKRPFLSYLSSCLRYFCKLQGARIINHCETRWQSASIVAKKTNETTHPGKWPGDLVWYWLPTVTEMCATLHGPPCCALSWPRPDKATKANQWGSLSVCSITGSLFQIWLGSVEPPQRGQYNFIWERVVCQCELVFPRGNSHLIVNTCYNLSLE